MKLLLLRVFYITVTCYKALKRQPIFLLLGIKYV